jgi:ABC-type multidrug transport system ATPase subunit/ABC-type multidrug transport system permease subunit
VSLDITIADLEEVTQTANRRGVRIEAVHLGRVVAGGRRILDDVSLTIQPGQLVAIAGGSGAGKSTLLDTLAGLRQPSSGSVRFDGIDDAKALGYVPQDDIIHRDLPLRTTLRYAAQLRLPAATPGHAIEAVIDDTLETLGLTERADVPVGRLSGGQRKRASIGVELLTRPQALFLDEPTSGLDPATANGLVRTLRQLADNGTTVVLTTHNTDDLRHCDRVLFLARGGRLAYAGPLDAAIRHFDVDDAGQIYDKLAPADDSEHRVEPRRDRLERTAATVSPQRGSPTSPPPGGWRQWAILTRRNLDAIVHNRLTLAITIGSPVAVIAMLAILFKSGTFDGNPPDTTTGTMVSFWIAFSAFFFGLTFGLLQICTELAILRRERFVGLNLGSYLLAKLAVLVPALFGVVVLMVAVLTALHRLPTMDAGEIARLIVTLLLDAIAATALGLLASAAVADPSQATLALPMLCFPAVLFSGAIVSTATMTAPGRAISVVTSNRWGFEAVERQLVGHGSSGGHWLVLAVFTAVFLGAAHAVLQRRTVAGPAR